MALVIDGQTGPAERPAAGRRSWVLLLLLIPFVGTLYPDWYARVQPSLYGIPFIGGRRPSAL